MSQERLEEIREARLKKRADILAAGQPAYPAEARRSHTVAEALDGFDELSAKTTPVTLVGRVMSVRQHGGLVFMDVRDESEILQWQITQDAVPAETWERLEWLDTGDFVQAAGQLVLSKRGVKTLLVKEWHFLSKGIRPIPSAWYGIKDKEQRYRDRELDFILNKDAQEILTARAKVLKSLRDELNRNGFLEVETPILQTMAGGATAEPFSTHHNALNTDLYLRIAPELFLKRLLVGGCERVFEIGRNFRNEGVDREHNPEFTMLEFYWAYADYEDLMKFTEELVGKVVKEIVGSNVVKKQGAEISFEAPWQKLNYIETVSKRLGFDILEEKNPEKYVAELEKANLAIPKVKTYAKLVDELFKELIRPGIIQPTIMYDYPAELVPLAKQKAQDPRVAEMFQVLVSGAELVKAYTEQNDPVKQREKFEEQREARSQGDKEAGDVDEEYLRAMEYGMPPVAGFGMGIDRLLWLITNSDNIRETIAFPILKPNHD
jgi:lysyl-tRNA synthetase, class II